MFERIKSLFQRPPDVEKAQDDRTITPPAPRGDVLGVNRATMRRRLLQLMSSARRDYTIDELRQAAKLPLISGILNTIIREVLSYELIIEEKQKSDDDAPLNQLRKILGRPNEYDRTLRVFLDGFMRDLLISGWVNLEKLREAKQQARKTAEAYLAGRIDKIAFAKQVGAANKQPGQILGWIGRDPARIWLDGSTSNFYEVGDISNVTTLTPRQKEALVSWSPEDMSRIYWAGTTETECRLMPLGPTAQCYAIIDILFATLVVLREQVSTPTMGKLISFIVPKDAVGLRAEQFNDLVEAMREDVASGTLPVLQGVRAFVDDIGRGIEAERLMLLILDEYELICWQVYGAGLVQMGRMEGQGRQMGAQQMVAARKQAVGHMLNIIRNDLIIGEIINDPWSPYSGLTARWVDVSAIPTRDERMEKEWVPLMRRGGIPPGAIIELDYPELKAVLEEQGIDIWALKPPELEAAMIRAGFVEGEEVEEEETEEEEPEEGEEEQEESPETKRFMEEILRKTLEVLGTKESLPRDIHIHIPEAQKAESLTEISVHVPEQPVHVDIGDTQVSVHLPEQVPPEVKIDAPISVETPEVKVEPIIHIDAPEMPEIKVEPTIHIDAPEIKPTINVPPAEVKVEPTIHVEAPEAPEVKFEPTIEVVADLDFSKTKIVPPEVRVEPVINIQVDAELHSPDETIETETMVERDKDGLIKKTKKTSKKRSKGDD